MPGYVNGIPHATSSDRIDLWPTTSRNLAQWVDDNVPRNDDPRLSDARTPSAHTHALADVTGLQAALNGKTDTTDPRLSDARPPTTHTHPISGVTGLQAALNGKTDTTDPRLSDARPPTAHTHAVADVTGLAARLAALEQDTGDRNITSLIPEATAGHWTVRRIGRWVYMNLYDLGLTATAGDYWQKTGFLPTGLRPLAASQYVHFTCSQRNTTGFTPGPFRVDRSGGVTVYGVTGKLTTVTAVWITNDAFPTTLPGVPA